MRRSRHVRGRAGRGGASRVRGRRLGAAASALLAAVALSVAWPATAVASSSWRCGNRLVHDGDAPLEVLRRCGDPTYRTTSVEYVTVRLRDGAELLRAVPVEVWTYNRGPRQFVRYLTFRDRRLVDVGEGDYGW